MKKVPFLFLLIASLFFSFPIFTHAQFGGAGLIGNLSDELNVSLSPAYPAPNQTVSVNLEMYTEDISSAQIDWYTNSSLKQSGKGLTNFSFKAPAAGSSLSLLIKITLQNGGSFEKSLTISPAGLEILWEANSYVPPFYPGKALFAPQGQIKILANSNFSSSKTSLNNDSSLVYKWTVNGEVKPNLGGYGKNTALITGPILGKGLDINIVATDPTTNRTAESTIYINPTYPTLLFYENNPLSGLIFEKALSGIQITGEETNIVAAPFTISRENMDSVNYTWRINALQAEGITGRSATFRKPEGITGISNISAEVENSNKPLQSAKGAFSISFENE